MKLTAPFTPLAVAALNRWQATNWVHPFTCPNRNDDAHHAYAEAAGHRDHGILIATRLGWVCPVCGHRQDWAHDFMAEAASLPHRPPWWTSDGPSHDA